MEPTDKNKPQDKTDPASDAAKARAGGDPVADLGGSEPPASGAQTAGQPADGASPTSAAGSKSTTKAGDKPTDSTAAAAASSDRTPGSPGSSASGASGTAPSTAKTGTATTSGASAGSASGKGAAAGGSSSASPPPAPPRKNGSSGGRGLASLALLVALAAGGFGVWQWYQDQGAEDSRSAELEQRMQQLEEDLRQSSEAQTQRLQDVPRAEQLDETRRLVDDLQRSQQRLRNRLEEQGDARTDWKLAEAEYLLRLASLRLMAAQDVRSAREMLEAVDQIMRDQPDSGVFAVREALARAQSELSALPDVDRAGIYLRLAALSDRVDQLVALPVPAFDPDQVSVEEEYEDRMARRTWAERMLMRLERYVRVDFQRGKVITPLMDEAEMQRIHRTLQLTLEQAQWAALRGEGTVYRSSLERAGEVLEQFFEGENQQVQAMGEQLSQLAERQVSLTPPDLAPVQRALNEYMQSRGQDSGASEQEAANE